MSDTKDKDFIKKAEDQKLGTENVKNTNVDVPNKNPDKKKMTFKDVATKVLEAVKKAKEALDPSRKRKASEITTPEETVKDVIAHLQEKVALRKSNSGNLGNNKAKKPRSI